MTKDVTLKYDENRRWECLDDLLKKLMRDQRGIHQAIAEDEDTSWVRRSITNSRERCKIARGLAESDDEHELIDRIDTVLCDLLSVLEADNAERREWETAYGSMDAAAQLSYDVISPPRDEQ